MMVRRKPQWNRLSSGLYVPPFLWLGNPPPCAGSPCCCECCACTECPLPTEAEVTISNIVNKNCVGCSEFNNTFVLPFAPSATSTTCFGPGGDGQCSLVHEDTFTFTSAEYWDGADCDEAITEIKILFGQSIEPLSGSRTRQVLVTKESGGGADLFSFKDTDTGTSAPWDCLIESPLSITFNSVAGIFNSCQGAGGDPVCTVVTGTPP